MCIHVFIQQITIGFPLCVKYCLSVRDLKTDKIQLVHAFQEFVGS